MKRIHRAVAALLALSLLSSAAPHRALAQVVRASAVPATGMPVSAVSGATGMTGATLAPLSFNASFVPGGASLAPSVSLAPQAGVSAALAPNSALSAAAPAALPAAASSLDEVPEAPKAAQTPKTGGRGVLHSLVNILDYGVKENLSAGEERPLDDALGQGRKDFDGGAEKTGGVEGSAPVAGQETAKKSLLKRWFGKSETKKAPTVDQFGGPLTTKMGYKQKLGYGLKWGLNMLGISAILNFTLRPILEIFPWPQYMSDAALQGFGRVALLAGYGPNEIVQGIAASPLTFFGLQLPFAVTMEELSYRLFGFGLIFLGMAAMKPVTRWISSLISDLPNASGIVGASNAILRGGEFLSRLAFPVAAVLSSLNFAIAHFANWGVSPFVLAINLVMGYSLARVAYRSRGLVAPITAHLFFNLALTAGVFVSLWLSPAAGTAYMLIASLLGIAALWYNARSAMKLKALKNAKGVALGLVMALGLGLWSAAPTAPDLAGRSVLGDGKAAIALVQDSTKTPATVPADTTAVNAAAGDSTAVGNMTIETLTASVKPAVVNVLTEQGTGSGFIVTPDGKFVTNAHVVGSNGPGSIIQARLPGVPMPIPVKVLAVNHDKDLAIVQLPMRSDGKPWPTVPLAPAAPAEGETVVAMGYPMGLPFTVTRGIVSGLGHRGNLYVTHMQTDAAINPGNSGGPLFNLKGQVVGVNTQIYTMSGGSQGLGFAITAPDVAMILAQYAQSGNIATAALGIIVDLSDPNGGDALVVEYARWGSAAEKAGLRRGDIIAMVNGQPIMGGGQQGAMQIAAILAKLKPGDKIQLGVIRGDAPVALEITLDPKHDFASR